MVPQLMVTSIATRYLVEALEHMAEYRAKHPMGRIPTDAMFVVTHLILKLIFKITSTPMGTIEAKSKTGAGDWCNGKQEKLSDNCLELEQKLELWK